MDIEHVFVINLDSRPDRLKSVQHNFRDTVIGHKLTRWPAVYGKEMSDAQIEKVSSRLCNYICSPSMVGCWLSHYSLWQHVVKNRLTNVLILEDDASPITDFDTKLAKILPDIPINYDIVYFGCFASCDDDMIDTGNKPVFVGGKRVDSLMIPAFPVGLHGYLLSGDGARKLTSYKELLKVNYHIDIELAMSIYGKKKDFRVYAVRNPLIKQSCDGNESNIQSNEHPLLNIVFSRIKVSNTANLDFHMNGPIIHSRQTGIRVNNFILLFAAISLLVGMTGSISVIKWYLGVVAGIYLIETSMGKFPYWFEAVVIIICVIAGKSISQFVKNNISN
jgi:glycosyl transferase family 25